MTTDQALEGMADDDDHLQEFSHYEAGAEGRGEKLKRVTNITDYKIVTIEGTSPRTPKITIPTEEARLARMGSSKSAASSVFSSDATDDEEDEDESVAAAGGVVPFGTVTGATQRLFQPYSMVIYTSTTHSNHFQEGNERRLVHLLDSKGLDYELVFIDLDENRDRRTHMVATSGLSEVPQVHINGKFFGTYGVLQEKEDMGRLDVEFDNMSIEVLKKHELETPRTVVRNSKADGPLTIHMTAKFALAKWDPKKAMISTKKKNFEWMLMMDEEPVYVGVGTQFTVTNITPGPHTFELSALDPDGEFVENLEGEQVYGEVTVEPPPPREPRTARGVASDPPLVRRSTLQPTDRELMPPPQPLVPRNAK